MICTYTSLNFEDDIYNQIFFVLPSHNLHGSRRVNEVLVRTLILVQEIHFGRLSVRGTPRTSGGGVSPSILMRVLHLLGVFGGRKPLIKKSVTTNCQLSTCGLQTFVVNMLYYNDILLTTKIFS